MRKRGVFLFLAFWFLSAFVSLARADIFGSIRGIVHDPQHRPIPGATVKLKSATSDLSQTMQTNADGEFTFASVPVGDYIVSVSEAGFADMQQSVTVAADSASALHFPLQIAGVNQTAVVTAQAVVANVESVTPTTLVNRQDIAQTPGADRTNGVQMITDFVPGSYVTHDMLHIRGGHQVSWLIDGVEIPNTNIANNLGPQIDPKDIDYLETQRGSYSADEGDRTFGIFNVVPRTGFERDNEAELVMSFGNWYQTNDEINFGGHTPRFAYFTSLSGNRSNLGLQTPIGQVFHDADSGIGGFGSFIFNASADNQFRLVTSLRRDYYQIPYDPNPNSAENQVFDTSRLRDGQREADAFLDFSWIRTFQSNLVLQVSPFYHYNSANYQGRANDFPVSTTSNRSSNYAGLQTTVRANVAHNDIQAGIYGFGQRDNNLFANTFNDGSFANFREAVGASGGLFEAFVDDKFKVTSWLTLMAGVRQSHFTSDVVENATSPRVGVAFQVPRLGWVFRAFYGNYYQAPPLLTPSGALLDFATSQNLDFAPLHGERDEEHQFGLTIPFRGWALDADTFKTRSKNFLDHNNIGESNLFFPLTFDGALIQAWELTLRSPRMWHRAQFHLAYSNQIAQARGPITGGLICGNPQDADCEPSTVYSPVDHDQRDTLNFGFTSSLPRKAYVSANVYYGSGLTNGSPNAQYPGDYLPQHTTFDLSLGKSFGEKYAVSLTALNAGNRRVLLDNSLTFGGFHYNDPREIYAEFRYRFHY